MNNNNNITKSNKKDLLGMTREELSRYFSEVGEKKFRAKQILQWIYQHRLRDFEPMTDLSIPLRCKLDEKAEIGRLEVPKKVSSPDGTTKLLFKFDDGATVEAVYIPADNRRTACLSTQVGCSLGCSFCATGNMGFARNLTVREIIGQFIGIEEALDVSLTNVVLMGMGEPLLNLPAVLSALDIMTDKCALALGHRRIVVSTVGIPDKIEELRRSGLAPKLAISLNAPDDGLRRGIMPAAAEIAMIPAILDAAARFATDTGRWFTVEYVLLAGINDSLDHADQLAELILQLPCKVNLVRYNPVDSLPYDSPSDEAVLKFQGYLLAAGVTATLRDSKGQSISAACGQLATKT